MSGTGKLLLNLVAEAVLDAADWRQGALDLSQAQRDTARSRASVSVAPDDGITLATQAQHPAKAGV